MTGVLSGSNGSISTRQPNVFAALGSPYPGKLGVVQQGALADLLLVVGDPITSIALVDDPAKNFVVIVKNGKIFKNLRRWATYTR